VEKAFLASGVTAPILNPVPTTQIVQSYISAGASLHVAGEHPLA